MAVPSSGQLRLRADIANEVDGSATGSNVSLQALSRSAGKSTPDGMLEFYGYSASVPPTVSTSSASSITNNQIILNGNVSNDGGAAITERGFYFGTSTNMTSNPKYSVGGTTGTFTLTRTGLSTSTTYRIWAYAKNASGTTYGAMVSAATYATMNYQVSTNSGDGGSYTYFHQWASNTPDGYGTYRDILQHPYLGGITLESTNFSGVNVGTDLRKRNRKFAYKSNPSAWGSNLCRTDWRVDCTVLYQYWQNSYSNGTYLVQFQEWSKSSLTTGYGWAAQGTSSAGYGGWGGTMVRTGVNNVHLEQGATNLTVWHIYNNTTVYK